MRWMPTKRGRGNTSEVESLQPALALLPLSHVARTYQAALGGLMV